MLFGMDSCLVRPRRKKFREGFVGREWRWAYILGVHLSAILHVRELPELATLVSLDRSS